MMATYLELMPGAAAFDDVDPLTEDNLGLRFPADGIAHSCGWTKFVPAQLRAPSTLTLRLNFVDEGVGVGVVRYVFTWYNTQDSGPILATGSHTLLVTVPNVASTIIQEDIDVLTWMNPSTTLFLLTVARDSSHVDDTFASAQQFIHGRIF